jgi:hypothetical protein
MAASLDDILTTQKNGVVAINGLNQTLKTIDADLQAIEADLPCICTNLAAIVVQLQGLGANLYPSDVSETIQASTTSLIVAGSGRIFAVSIPTHSGSAQIEVYNSATTGGIAATNLIYKSLPSNAASFVPYGTVNLAYTDGIVIKTDAGITCCVAYTPAP